MSAIQIDGENLSFELLYSIVFDGATVELAAVARKKMLASRAVVERLIESGDAVYGVNTGFGKLASVRITREQIGELQVNLVRSHACGMGAPLRELETRAMLALRANAIAKGFSGVRPVVAETLCAMLNAGVHPVIPSQGSVGASGDLAPLAHLAQVAIGEGEAIFQGRKISGGEAMRAAGIASLALEAKEGLALLNGTQGMLALLALALRDAEIAVDTADVAAALSLDALRGSPVAFDERIAEVRPYAGHATTARNLRRLNEGSTIRESHRSAEKDKRVQDAYSLRCAPQVHGAVRDALVQVSAILSVELNSATDNPLVFADSGEVISGGNFRAADRADDQSADEFAAGFFDTRGGAEFRIHDFAGSGGGAGRRNQDAGDATFGGFDSDVGESGRLRFDGDERSAEDPADTDELAERAGDRAAERMPRVGPACAFADGHGSAEGVCDRTRRIEDGGCGPISGAGHSRDGAQDRGRRLQRNSALSGTTLCSSD
ncbi:MAG: aromatic amino acid lyase [Candidatus Acidiferrales bacterium]